MDASGCGIILLDRQRQVVSQTRTEGVEKVRTIVAGEILRGPSTAFLAVR